MSAKFPWKRLIVAAIVASLLLYWLLIFTLTHLPPQKIPSAGVSHDKLAHLLAYFGLSFLLTLALLVLCHFRWRLLVYAVLAAAIYGALDEVTQLLVGRTADLRDWVADVIGATLGALAGCAFYLVARKVRDVFFPVATKNNP